MRISYAYSNRANAYEVAHNYLSALADCNKAISLDSNNKYAYFCKGNAHYNLSENSKAIDAFNKTIELYL